MKNRAEPYAQLINQAHEGRLDGLECLTCHNNSVSVWFTNPAPEEYREYFICSVCGFHFSARIKGRPAFFSELRVHHDLQKTDEELFRKTTAKLEEMKKARK